MDDRPSNDPMLIALLAKVDAELVKLNVLVRHAPDGSESVVEPPKLQTDVRGARAIAILGKLTVFFCVCIVPWV